MAEKTPKKTMFLRIIIVLISIFIGVAIVANFISKKQPPKRVEAIEAALSVQTINPVFTPLILESSGFGAASPAKTWSAISNVKGRVIFRHEELESGAILTKDTLLMQIDDGSYQLVLSEAAAEIANIDAQIAQLEQEYSNIGELLELEKERLDIAEIDLERTEKLEASGAIARANLDTQLRQTLQQRQAVQNLINQQNISPIKLDQLKAQKERALIKREQVKRDIKDTSFYAPFDLRIGEVKAENYQYINVGQVLFSGDGIDNSEVILQMPMQSLKRILAELSADTDGFDLSSLIAYVALVDKSQKWNAKVIRIANGIDPATRTVRVVLSVDQPKNAGNQIQNPPLVKGMYVEGILTTQANEKKLIIPEATLQDGLVYLVNKDNRLERREVEIDFIQDGLAVIKSGLDVNDRLIINDISPAISGLLLNPTYSQKTEDGLLSKALGDPQ